MLFKWQNDINDFKFHINLSYENRQNKKQENIYVSMNVKQGIT